MEGAASVSERHSNWQPNRMDALKRFSRIIAINAAFLIIIFVLLLQIVYFSLNILPHKERLASRLISQWCHQPILIQGVSIRGAIMNPIFSIDRVEIAEHQNQIILNHVQIHLDVLRSLWRRTVLIHQVMANSVILNLRAFKETPFSPMKLTHVLIQHPNHQPVLSGEWNTALPTPAHIDMPISWQSDASDLKIQSTLMKVYNADFELVSQWRVDIQDKQSPRLVFLGDLYFPNIKHFSQYVPDHLVNPGLKKWMQQAFLTGQIVHARLLFKGALNAFPFDESQGHFEAIADVKNVTLHFFDHWPSVSHINGIVKMDNRRLMIHAKNTMIANMLVQNADAEIQDLAHPILTVHANTKTDFSNALFFLKQTPLSAENDLSAFSGAGPVDIHVQLKIPLNEKKVIPHSCGQIQFLNDTLSFSKWPMILNRLSGDMQFRDEIVWSHHLRADFLQQPFVMHITANRDGMIKLSGHLSHWGAVAFIWKLAQKTMTFFSGQVQMGSQKAVFLHSPGLLISGYLPTLDMSAWQTWLEKHPIHSFISPEKNFILPSFFRNAEIMIGDLIWSHQQWKNIDIKITAMKNAILMQSVGKGLNGNVLLPENKSDIVQAHFDQLFLTRDKNDHESAWDPRQISPLFLDVRDFRFNHHRDGHVILKTQRTEQGMLIRTINVQAPLFSLDAHGEWMAKDNQPETHLIGHFSSPDFGRFLSNRHISTRLKGGALESDFSLQWKDEPRRFAFSKVVGHMALFVKKGRILQLNSETESNLDFGRMLNLLSLESISQYLTFNFSSLSKRGFPFDDFDARFQFNWGRVMTKDAILNGPLAKINLRGVIGLGEESNRVTIIVMPYVSSSLPFIIGVAGGPIAGAATWLVNKIISPGVGHLMQSTYHVTGKWGKLTVQKV